jgi:hypothetical protein
MMLTETRMDTGYLSYEPGMVYGIVVGNNPINWIDPYGLHGFMFIRPPLWFRNIPRGIPEENWWEYSEYNLRPEQYPKPPPPPGAPNWLKPPKPEEYKPEPPEPGHPEEPHPPKPNKDGCGKEKCEWPCI